MLTDKDIILLFFVNDRLRRNWERLLDEEIELYLLDRFIDSESIRESLYRIKDGIEYRPKCPICGKNVKCSLRLGRGRHSYLLYTCGNKSCENAWRNKQKIQGYINKFGVDNPFRLDNVKEKIRNTNIEKYGGPSCICDPEINKQAIETKRKLYNGKGCNYEAYQQTMLKKYGVDNFWKTEQMRILDADPEMHRKRVKTTKENFIKNTNGKYSWHSQLPEAKEKVKQTCLEKYGVPCYFKTEKCKEKANSVEAKLKRKQSLENRSDEEWEKYYNNWYNSLKKNNSFNKSKPEEECYNLLKEKFPDIIRQYRDKERYPFACDFYIPSLDLFIEFQGSQYHGVHPYDFNNIEDLQQVNLLKEKSKKSKRHKEGKKSQYDTIIETWTIRDVNKRETAKKNNLNWIEFFTLNELKNWLENYDKNL